MTIQDENIRLKEILKNAIYMLKEIDKEYYENDDNLYDDLETTPTEMYALELIDELPFTETIDEDDDGSLYWQDVE